jgi:hypothetical protein
MFIRENSKFKKFGNLAFRTFGHLDLFRIWCLVLRILVV